MTCRISHFQDNGSFQLNPLFATGKLRILRRIVTNHKRRYKQIALNKGNNKITELRAILQRESQNS
jgi:hypothetical protein